jgi:hypothetical protein
MLRCWSCLQRQLKAFLDKNSKKEKIGGKQEQSALVLELFEMRRDVMSRISEDLVKEKKQLDVEVGYGPPRQERTTIQALIAVAFNVHAETRKLWPTTASAVATTQRRRKMLWRRGIRSFT